MPGKVESKWKFETMLIGMHSSTAVDLKNKYISSIQRSHLFATYPGDRKTCPHKDPDVHSCCIHSRFKLEIA
jgi:hypothetical protein